MKILQRSLTQYTLLVSYGMEVIKIQNHNIFGVAGRDRRMLEEESHN